MKAGDKSLHPTIYLTIEAKSDKICVSVTINTAGAKPSPVNGSLKMLNRIHPISPSQLYISMIQHAVT
jgi:hypothetical protein